MKKAAEVILVIKCVLFAMGGFIIYLAWTIPFIIHIRDARKEITRLSVGFKICVLIFSGIIS